MKKSSKQIKLDKIKNDLCKFDLLAPGRLRTTFMKCGNPKCACHKDKKARHGPYHLWDRKVGTKLTSKMVPDNAHKKIESWIKERKRLEKLMAEAIKISQEIIADGIEKERERK
jgi:hypothetical protein